jgi:putative SOS response-associated peptidase YedK
MCGRFVSASPPAEIARYFGVTETADVEARANYNVAPTTDVWVVHADGGVRRLDPFRWGLVPHWAKDLSIGSKMINARAETVATKNAFKSSLAKRRCIVPADGFYEWKAPGPGQKRKQPYFIHRPDGEPFAFGGLWTEWRGKDTNGEDVTVRTTTIITGPANEKMAELHDRMPIILPPSAWEEWLDPEQRDLDTIGRFLVPAPPELIEFHPVSTDVNSVRNNDPHLVERVEGDATQGTLL